MDERDDFQGRVLVRTFSDHIQSATLGSTTLGLALKDSVDATTFENFEDDSTRRRRMFQVSERSGQAFDLLKTERDLIVKAWSEFVGQLPDAKPSRKARLFRGKTVSNVDEQLRQLQVYTIEDVRRTVEDAKVVWESKHRIWGGKIQNGFRKMCSTLDNHKTIFKAMPSQNDYTSIMCGSLQMLIKASVNHDKYIEELAEALGDISAEIQQAVIIRGIMGVKDLQCRVADLYAAFFGFLRESMIWYHSGSLSKIRHAFNETFLEQLRKQVSRISQLSQLLYRCAQTRGLIEQREARLVSEDTNITVNLLSHQVVSIRRELLQQLYQEREETRRLQQAFIEALRQPSKRKELGDMLAMSLEAMHKDRTIEGLPPWRGVDQDLGSNLAETATDEYVIQYDLEEISTEEKAITSADIMKLSDLLDEYITGFDADALLLRSAPSYIDERAVRRLQKWSSVTTSEILWVQGPPAPDTPSTMAGVAVDVLSAVKELNIPVITHACAHGSSVRESESKLTKEELGIIGLVYSLIQQLLELLLLLHGNDVPSAFANVEELDGSLDSWDVALDMLEILLRKTSPFLICIIDGLNRLERGSTTEYCNDVLQVLHDAMEDHECALKILFTTSGNSKQLRSIVPSHSLCVVEELPVKHRKRNRSSDNRLLTLHNVYGGVNSRAESEIEDN